MHYIFSTLKLSVYELKPFHIILKGPCTKFEVELMSYNYPYFCYDYTTSNSNILVEKILLK